MAVITLLVFALVAVLSYTQISNQRAILEEELRRIFPRSRPAWMVCGAKGFKISRPISMPIRRN